MSKGIFATILLTLGILSGFVFADAVVNYLSTKFSLLSILIGSFILTFVLVSLGASSSMMKKMF